MKRQSQSGIALVITLIMLSVITFMAVTFLVISHRGGEQTSTFTQQVIARQAAEQALEQFKSGEIADMIGRNNGFDFGLRVSTNYQSSYFTNSGPGVVSITNVNYYYANGQLLSPGDMQQMLANQMILPSPPVFITTNKAFPPDFRSYLDLNRNGVFDPTGPGPVTDQFGTSIQNLVGDPQWIGILEHPDQPHSSGNRYIARYCFIAIPIGNSLDFNAIHNNAKRINTPGNDGFYRNEGVGSWEINLAGFLAALNPNIWNPPLAQYFYDTNYALPNAVVPAFNDAASILQYRYNGSFNNLSNFSSLYTQPVTFFAQNNIDAYSAGPLMNSFSLPVNNDNASVPWSGADNPQHFYTSQDYFNILSGPSSFAARLQAPGFNTVSNFDRYTYYRMLSQMGTDSAPEDTNKLNLNYVNVGGLSATNFISWDDPNLTNVLGVPGSLAFFTNAVNRLLATQPDFAGLSSTNIPIYPVNRYTPAVHRLLQLAANIYDATTVHPFDANFPVDQLSYPSVFRPTFTNAIINGITNVIINGYTNIDESASNYVTHPVEAASLLGSANFGNVNVYGIPWVIGARQGFPNLNQVAMQGTFSLTRKLQIVKNANNPTEHSLYHTNVQYVLGISNTVAVQAWNSYARAYPRAVKIVCFDEVDLGLTNQTGAIVLTPPLVNHYTNAAILTIPPNTWAGYPGPNAPATNIAKSFDIAIDTTNILLPSVVFHPSPPGSYTVNANVATVPFDTTVGYPQPFYGFHLTNRLWFYMQDSATGRVIDYAQFGGMTSQQDLMSEVGGNGDLGNGDVWDTNRVDGSTNVAKEILGIENQVQASEQDPPYSPIEGVGNQLTLTDWASAGIPNPASVHQATSQFKDFYNGNDPSLIKQVPYSPTRTASVYYSWQANDPLVHYTLSDLTPVGDLNVPNNGVTNYDKAATDHVQQGLYQVNSRYLPWGGFTARNGGPPNAASYDVNIALIDPQITRSDNWQFPTNKFPNIGWLGRVHRGTPWQTVYMKSPTVDHGQWASWSGNSLSNYPGLGGVPYDDSADAQPINDRAIFDLFTTAPNDNATRGQLSINQTGLAAWTAVLAGAIAMTNDPANPGNYGPLVIDPTTVNPATGGNAIQQIVSDLNASKTNYLGNVWVRLGDVLSTPSLTVNSPFLNTNGVAASDVPNDFAYERIPQQIMSLLRVGSPRYVVYAYGQSLKPALNSLVTSGPFFQLCTNYQITGEVATRTVVRFEPSGPLNPFSPSTPFNPTRNPAMVGQKFGGGNGQPNPRAVIESFTVLPPE